MTNPGYNAKGGGVPRHASASAGAAEARRERGGAGPTCCLQVPSTAATPAAMTPWKLPCLVPKHLTKLSFLWPTRLTPKTALPAARASSRAPRAPSLRRTRSTRSILRSASTAPRASRPARTARSARADRSLSSHSLRSGALSRPRATHSTAADFLRPFCFGVAPALARRIHADRDRRAEFRRRGLRP